MINKESLSAFFSRNSIARLVTNKDYSQYINTVTTNLSTEYVKLENREIIRLLYKKLSKSYRNEYFYKNTLFNKKLIGTHSINTMVALAEIPVSKSIADIVLVNGDATVYEIKSDVDKLVRIEQQVTDYYKAFGHVYIVTKYDNCEKVESSLKNKDVGILYLNNRNNLSCYKKSSENYSNLEFDVLFKLLRKKEYEQIIIERFGKLPSTNPINHFSMCYKVSNEIPLVEYQKLVVKQLRKRKIALNEEFLNIVPEELRYAVYFSKMNKLAYEELNSFLNKQYGGL